MSKTMVIFGECNVFTYLKVRAIKHPPMKKLSFSSFPLIVIITTSICLLTACTKDPVVPTLSSEKEITEFKLEKELNADYLKKTIVGTIENSVINLVIPELTDASKLVATFTFKGDSVTVASAIQESGKTNNDFTKPITYTVTAEDGSEKKYLIKVEISFKPDIPQLYITTENEVDINSKATYVKATLKINGLGMYDDYEGTMSIKGRGNSTWNKPKKPYRLKLDSKASLFGLSAEKDWILLANYVDHTLMLSAVAFKTAQLLEMPYTNHVIPVDVTLNGTFLGNYMFTEQKEVETNRINVVDGGVWLELDTYFDEPWKFKSYNYQLPVMVQYPKLDKISKAEADVQFAEIKSDFEAMENTIFDPEFPHNNYHDYIDITSLARYFLVYDFTLNGEINHPKSTFMYKPKDGKYHMGPVWDFDWAFGYDGTDKYFTNPSGALFGTGDSKSSAFFSRFMEDPAVRTLFKNEWNTFKASKLNILMAYIDDYSNTIKGSYQRNYNKWKLGSDDLDDVVRQLKSWLNARVTYLDSYTAGM